jgi:hypothetical protein
MDLTSEPTHEGLRRAAPRNSAASAMDRAMDATAHAVRKSAIGSGFSQLEMSVAPTGKASMPTACDATPASKSKVKRSRESETALLESILPVRQELEMEMQMTRTPSAYVPQCSERKQLPFPMEDKDGWEEFLRPTLRSFALPNGEVSEPVHRVPDYQHLRLRETGVKFVVEEQTYTSAGEQWIPLFYAFTPLSKSIKPKTLLDTFWLCKK